MSKLAMHKCVICGCIFHHGSKNTYCAKCIPRIDIKDGNDIYRKVNEKIESRKELNRARARERWQRLKNNQEYREKKRLYERERWHQRMKNPEFREHERLRSLERYRLRRLKEQWILR